MSTTLRQETVELNDTNPNTSNNNVNMNNNNNLILPSINIKPTNPNPNASTVSLSSKLRPASTRQLSTSSYHPYAPIAPHDHEEHQEIEMLKTGDKKENNNNNGNDVVIQMGNEELEKQQRALNAVLTSPTIEQLLAYRQPGERKPFHQKIYKTPKETAAALLTAAKNKSELSWDKIILSAFISGVFVAYGGIFGLTVYTGSPSMDPGTRKLLFGLTFEVALVFIILFGGELFTGNTMTMTIGWLGRAITWRDWTKSLVLTWVFNFVGCLFGAVFFAYFTEIFAADPYLSGVRHLAELKCTLPPHAVFLRAIAANWLVCMAVFMGSAAESIEGKILACVVAVTTFAASSFEHTIANMFFIPLGLLLGAQTDVATFISRNLLLSTAGNFVGGALFMGCVVFWLYLRNSPVKPLVTKGTMAAELSKSNTQFASTSKKVE